MESAQLSLDFSPQTEKLPDWEVMMSVLNIDGRPRRTSLHTLASMLGRTDLLKLAEEMQASGKVVGFYCGTVQCPVFFLRSMRDRPGMSQVIDNNIWGDWPYPQGGVSSLKTFIEANPSNIKGFKRYAWRGNSRWLLKAPYESDDLTYAKKIRSALVEAGYNPGVKEEELVE